MSDTSQPDPGGRRVDDAARARGRRRRQKVSRRWLEVGLGAMAVALLVSGATLGRPVVDALFEDTAAVAAEPKAAAAAAAPPTSITLPVPERKAAEPGPSGIAQLRKELSRATAQAQRQARLMALPMPVKVAYFNMLGCYHTDRDEPHYGFLAYHYGPCSSRMPQQFGWLAAQGISIAGVGEFQGKAWRVLRGFSGGSWDVWPRGQSGPYGQNPVVWRAAEWAYVSGEQIRIPYNCANGGSCRASSSLVRLKHRKTGREVYVLNTHHASDGGAGGGGRRAAATGIELSRIRAVHASGIPVIYMGDFNEGTGRVGGALKPAFSGMGIDQVWGTDDLSFEDGHYDGAFRRWTDHGSGIAVVTALIPGIVEVR